MKKLFMAAILLLFSTTVYAEDFRAQYVKNYDGDTITVNLKDLPDLFGKNMPVRVLGIDTPEIKGKCDKEKSTAYEAKKVVKDMLTGSDEILLKNCIRGKYFRIVADVIVDGKSVSEELIKRGLAVPYYGKTKVKDWCE